MLVLFVVGFELYEDKVRGSCAARRNFDIVRYVHWVRVRLEESLT